MKLKGLAYFFKSVAKKLEGKIALQTFLVWVLFFCLYSLVLFTVNGVSYLDDQWFHIKYAYLLRTRGWEVVTHFQWLHFTDLVKYGRPYGVTLFHYFLIPFTFFPDMIFGMKLADAFMAAFVFASFFYVLRKLNIGRPAVWTLLLFTFSTYNFASRMLLGRNLVLTPAFGLVEFYFLIRRKYFPLFILAIIHTWWHPATFWLVPFLAVSIEAVRYLNERNIKFKGFIVGTTGSFLGFLLFPPNSDHLYAAMNPIDWTKTFINFFYQMNQGIGIKEGTEAYKLSFTNFSSGNYLLVLAVILISIFSIWVYVAKKRGKNDPEEDSEISLLRDSIFLITMVFFLGMIEITVRFQDFLIPFLFLGVAILYRSIVKNKWVSFVSGSFKKTLIFSLAVFVLMFTAERVLDLRNGFFPKDSYSGYAKAATWLENNTSKGALVFNTNWDQFPRLFFYDSWNRYIVGIEAKSLYKYDPGMYWLWHNAVYNGLYCNRPEDCSADINKEFSDIDTMGPETRRKMAQTASLIAPMIKNTFQSRYVFFGKDTLFRREVSEDKADFELKFFDKETNTYIYYVK